MPLAFIFYKLEVLRSGVSTICHKQYSSEYKYVLQGSLIYFYYIKRLIVLFVVRNSMTNLSLCSANFRVKIFNSKH